MRQLIDLRNANVPILSVGTIPWVEKFLPGLAVPGVRTASQSAYRRVANSAVGGRNTTDFTFVQLLWDDGLGAGGASNLFIHPQ